MCYDLEKSASVFVRDYCRLTGWKEIFCHSVVKPKLNTNTWGIEERVHRERNNIKFELKYEKTRELVVRDSFQSVNHVIWEQKPGLVLINILHFLWKLRNEDGLESNAYERTSASTKRRWREVMTWKQCFTVPSSLGVLCHVYCASACMGHHISKPLQNERSWETQ